MKAVDLVMMGIHHALHIQTQAPLVRLVVVVGLRLAHTILSQWAKISSSKA